MQVSFDDVIKQERHGRARDARHNNLEPKGKRVLFPKRFFAVLKLEREHFVPEQDDHRKDCAELNHNKEHFLERIVCVELQELIHKQHVPGAADRQPFGNPFHNPEENHFQKLNKIQHAAAWPPLSNWRAAKRRDIISILCASLNCSKRRFREPLQKRAPSAAEYPPLGLVCPCQLMVCL